MHSILLAIFLLLATLLQAGDRASAPSMPLKPGQAAPDFTLKDQSGREVSLHDYRGKRSVILAFYVFAFTGG